MNNFTIAHSIKPYLFQTGNWIYNQLINSNTIRHIVLTARKENTDQFPFDPVYSLSDLPRIRQFSEKGYQKIFNKWYPYWLNTCKKEKVDILHSHFGPAGVRNMKFAEKLKIPHVVSFYGSDIGQVLYNNPNLKKEYKKLFEKVIAVFVEGPYSKKSIMDLGCPENKIYISHLGVDLGSIKAQKRKWESKSPFRIFIVGTFTKKKGIIVALKAINEIISNKNYNIEITLIGDSKSSSESIECKKELLNFVGNSKLKNITKIYGYLPYNKILNMSYDHHLFMQTSMWGDDNDCEGGFPVIITDMMATGMPVLGSTHCDIPEIIKNEKNGLLANEGNLDDTIEKVDLILNNYNSINENWYNYNRKFLADHFNANKCSAKREEFYKKFVL